MTYVMSNTELAEAIKVAWNSEHRSPIIQQHLKDLLEIQKERARATKP